METEKFSSFSIKFALWILIIGAFISIFSMRSLIVDGAGWYFDATCNNKIILSPSRIFADFPAQLPILIGQKLGISNPKILVYLLGFGTILLPIIFLFIVKSSNLTWLIAILSILYLRITIIIWQVHYEINTSVFVFFIIFFLIYSIKDSSMLKHYFIIWLLILFSLRIYESFAFLSLINAIFMMLKTFKKPLPYSTKTKNYYYLTILLLSLVSIDNNYNLFGQERFEYVEMNMIHSLSFYLKNKYLLEITVSFLLFLILFSFFSTFIKHNITLFLISLSIGLVAGILVYSKIIENHVSHIEYSTRIIPAFIIPIIATLFIFFLYFFKPNEAILTNLKKSITTSLIALSMIYLCVELKVSKEWMKVLDNIALEIKNHKGIVEMTPDLNNKINRYNIFGLFHWSFPYLTLDVAKLNNIKTMNSLFITELNLRHNFNIRNFYNQSAKCGVKIILE